MATVLQGIILLVLHTAFCDSTFKARGDVMEIISGDRPVDGAQRKVARWRYDALLLPSLTPIMRFAYVLHENHARKYALVTKALHGDPVSTVTSRRCCTIIS